MLPGDLLGSRGFALIFVVLLIGVGIFSFDRYAVKNADHPENLSVSQVSSLQATSSQSIVLEQFEQSGTSIWPVPPQGDALQQPSALVVVPRGSAVVDRSPAQADYILSNLPTPEAIERDSKIDSNRAKRHFKFSLFPSNSMFQANDKANNSTARVASNVNFGLQGAYVQHISSAYQLGGEVWLSQMNFNEIDSRAIDGNRQNYFGYALSFKRRFEGFSLNSTLGADDCPFILGVNGSDNLVIKKSTVPYFALGIDKTLVSFDSGFHLDAELQPRVLFPTTSNGIRSHLGYGAKAIISTVDESKNGNAFFLGLSVRWESQKSVLVDQVYFEGRMEFGFRWGNSK